MRWTKYHTKKVDSTHVQPQLGTGAGQRQHTKDNERESTRICKIPKKGSLAFVHIDVCSSKNTIIGSWQVPIISYVDKTLENWPLVQSFIKQWQLWTQLLHCGHFFFLFSFDLMSLSHILFNWTKYTHLLMLFNTYFLILNQTILW